MYRIDRRGVQISYIRKINPHPFASYQIYFLCSI